MGQAVVPESLDVSQGISAMKEKMLDDLPSVQHYNSWPNSVGFDTVYEEREPVELEVTGHIPSYAAGTLYRTGAGPMKVNTDGGRQFRVSHWFDNLSINHRFQIVPSDNTDESCRVVYNSRLTCDGLIEKIKKTGVRDEITFGARYDPCKTFFKKLQSVFNPSKFIPVQRQPNEASVAVTMSCNFPGLSKDGKADSVSNPPNQDDDDAQPQNRRIKSLCNKTDANVFQMLDPETLEPVGIASQSVLHSDLKGQLSSAHAATDPITGDVYNYNLEFVNGKGLYRVFTVSASTGKTAILASFDADAAYIHSFLLTENYVVLCIWNSFFTRMGLDLIWKQNIVDAMQYDGSKRARWLVIDRKIPAKGGRGVVASYESEPFFCFHTVNAYEQTTEVDNGAKNENGTTKQTGQTDIIADLCTYPNLDILKHFYLENLMSDSPKAISIANSKDNPSYPSIWRFRLPSIPTTTSTSSNTHLPTSHHRRRSSGFFASTSPIPPPQPAIIEHKIPLSKLNLDLPTIHPHHSTRPHRYIYGISQTSSSTFPAALVKFDCVNHEVKLWEVHGHTAGEPIFVPRPKDHTLPNQQNVHHQQQQSSPSLLQAEPLPSEQEEDDGILLSVVLDGTISRSYLLVLDAKDLKEIGRAECKGAVGFGFHGIWVK